MESNRPKTKETFFGLLFSCSLPPSEIGQSTPPEWPYSQDLQVTQKGLTKAELPMETLSNAQSTLADLRLMDPTGQEVSYYIEQPLIEPARQMPLDHVTITMARGKTVVIGMIPPMISGQGLNSIVLFSPTEDFLKPITLETSNDRSHWTTYAKGYPIFKQPGQAISTSLELPKINQAYLRLTLDDSATPPIRVQGIELRAAPKTLPTLERVQAQILEANSDSHETVVQLLLPADNLTLDSIRLETPETTFRRRVTVSLKTFSAGEFRDAVLGQGFIYRVAFDQKAAEGLAIPLGRQIPGRQLILHIENGDSRPLTLSKVAADVVPAYMIFDAPAAGTYSVWVGNLLATPKTYDVASLQDKMVTASFAKATFGAFLPNTAYRPPEPLPEVQGEGTSIDISPWHFRKSVEMPSPSPLPEGEGLRQSKEGVGLLPLGEGGRRPDEGPRIWRLELDLEALAHNAGRLGALRLVRRGNQIPYIVDDAGVSREFQPTLESQPPTGNRSRWLLTLPYKGIPLSQLQFIVDDALFQRNVQVYQDVPSEQGEKPRTQLHRTGSSWTRTHGEQQEGFTIQLGATIQGDKLYLEMDNGDNPPIHVSNVRAFYQASRILFKATPGAPLYLYYGQDDAAAPQYDLNLIAGEILAAPPLEVKLGPEEVLKVRPWWDAPVPTGGTKWLFWIVMGLVVVGLLTVIAKLLPAEETEG